MESGHSNFSLETRVLVEQRRAEEKTREQRNGRILRSQLESVRIRTSHGKAKGRGVVTSYEEL